MLNRFRFYQNLSDSEKTYVKVALVFFPTLLLVVAFTTYYRSIGKVEAEVHSYKDALRLIRLSGPEYLATQQAQEESVNHKKLDQDTLENNTIKLTSFIAGIASSIDLSISSYDENDLPYDSGGGDKDTLLIERTLSFDVEEADLAKLMTLMERIESADEPVYVKHYLMSKRGPDPTVVRAKIVVATFLVTGKAS